MRFCKQADPRGVTRRVHLLVVLIMLSLMLSSCIRLKIALDKSSIEGISDDILADFSTDSSATLKAYLDDYSLVDTDQPLYSPKIDEEPLETWLLEGDLIQKKISFSSPITRENGQQDTATFYLYQNGSLKEGKVILWIPGFGVSDLAFWFIKEFFYNEIKAGYSVLFYNIPYHLDRIEDDAEMGEGLFTASHIHNLETVRHILYEISVALAYLKQKEVADISGWGGSIGAAFLWLSSHSFRYDHMTLMIPIVDWHSIIFNPSMKPVLDRMLRSGLTRELLHRSYQKINPINVSTRTDPDKIQILYARHDQLTPEKRLLEFVKGWGISNLHGYEESHSSILINDEMYDVNLDFLRRLQKTGQNSK